MLIHKKTRKLLLNLREPDRVTTIMPSAKSLVVRGKTLVAVPHKLDEVRVLRNIGIDAPSPIDSYYEWPGRYKPFAHQRITSAFLTLNPRAFCLNDMGAGKTMSVLWAFDYLRKAGLLKRMLVVSPLSTLERAWGDEIFRHFPDMSFAVLHGTRETRHKLLAEDFDVYIINHDGIKSKQTLDLLATREGLDLVAVDECFPAGTTVATPKGEKPIETLNLGDLVDSSWGPRPITHVFRKHVSVLVAVEFSDGRTIRCTPEHPFATDRGWVAAKDLAGRVVLGARGLQDLRTAVHETGVPAQESAGVLQPVVLLSELRADFCGSYLPYVRVGLQQETLEPAGVLQPTVLARIQADGAYGRDEELRGVLVGVLCRSEPGKVSAATDMLIELRNETQVGSPRNLDARRYSQGRREAQGSHRLEQRSTDAAAHQGAPVIAGQGQQSPVLGSPWGQRSGDVSGGVLGGCSLAAYVRVQRGYSDQAAEGQRVSDLLQSGLWGSRIQAGSGGGRPEPQHVEAPSTGPEERGVSSHARVARVTRIELDCPTPVWNLEVEGPHDYVTGGWVVHNCASFRNPNTERWKALNRLVNGDKKAGLAPKEWVWGLTGTPIPNAPTDAYGQAKLVVPHRVPQYLGRFRDSVMKQNGPFKWVPRDDATAIVKEAMQPAVRFSREECIDLPPTTFVTRQTELTPEQQKAFNDMLRKLRAEHDGGQITAVNEAVKLSKLLQILAGVAYGTTGEVTIPAGPRIELVREIIEEADAKVLVFVPFTAALLVVAEELRKNFTVEVVHGETSKSKRDQIFSDFQNAKNPRVLVANSGTLSHGLTLTAASTVVWYSPIFSNEIYRQANARVTRPGQKLNTLIVNIEATELERKVYARLQGKEKAQGLLLDLLKGAK
jgi:superfamily II DNA or RNA helicase